MALSIMSVLGKKGEQAMHACISVLQRQMESSNMSCSMAVKKAFTAARRAVMTTSRVVSAVTKGLPSLSPPIHEPKLNRLCVSGSIGCPICMPQHTHDPVRTEHLLRSSPAPQCNSTSHPEAYAKMASHCWGTVHACRLISMLEHTLFGPTIAETNVARGACTCLRAVSMRR